MFLCPFLQILLPLSSQPLLQLCCQQKPLWLLIIPKVNFFQIKKKKVNVFKKEKSGVQKYLEQKVKVPSGQPPSLHFYQFGL